MRELVPTMAVRDPIAKEIEKERAAGSASHHVCRADLNRLRTRHVHALLEKERGELTTLETEVLASLEDVETLARDPDSRFDQGRTLGDRVADQIAEFGGSWRFVIGFAVFVLLWIAMNSLVLLWRPLDPFPYILLNLMLSCLAALQAPVIMMSQNRQEAKDRARAQHDYQVNLKAELEIRHLHEKMDHLLSHQWERLAEIQEIQVELLAEISRRR
jgi:uncharacterized membrane protein